MCVVCQGNDVKNNNIWISCNLLYSFMFIEWSIIDLQGFSGGSVVKTLPANVADTCDLGLIPRLGRSLGGGNSNPLQYSCLGNPVDRGAWRAAVHSQSRAWLRMHIQLYGMRNPWKRTSCPKLTFETKKASKVKEASNSFIISKLSRQFHTRVKSAYKPTCTAER